MGSPFFYGVSECPRRYPSSFVDLATREGDDADICIRPDTSAAGHHYKRLGRLTKHRSLHPPIYAPATASRTAHHVTLLLASRLSFPLPIGGAGGIDAPMRVTLVQRHESRCGFQN